MAYQTLYRKWRPMAFADVVGQPHVTETFKNQIITGKVGHAYIFTGTRGTGKTTCAKILSKAVNCEHPVDGDPCNECPSCVAINEGSVYDVFEMDAASNSRVDDMRSVLDAVIYTPAQVKKRVYIIDEVHNLSSSAFNALLKTLEEPPEHALFILATTEINKVPATILSRCQRFDFRRITTADIAGRIKYICEQEKIEADEDAITLIAKLGDGSMRDALSILDQCIAITKGMLTADGVREAVGVMDEKYLFEISAAAKAGDTTAVIEIFDKVYSQGKDVSLFCSELLSHFRDILIMKTANEPQTLLDCTTETLRMLERVSAKYTVESALYAIYVLDEIHGRLPFSVSNKRVEMEIALLKLCSRRYSAEPQAIAARMSELEAELITLKAALDGKTVIVAEKADEQEMPTKPMAAEEPKAEKKEKPKPRASTAEERAKAKEILESIKQTAKQNDELMIFSRLKEASAYYADGVLTIKLPDKFSVKLFENGTAKSQITKYATAAAGEAVVLKLTSVDDEIEAEQEEKPKRTTKADVSELADAFPDIIDVEE